MKRTVTRIVSCMADVTRAQNSESSFQRRRKRYDLSCRNDDGPMLAPVGIEVVAVMYNNCWPGD